MLQGSLPGRDSTPDLDALVAKLRKKAERLDIKLPLDAARYIAHSLRLNERAMERALIPLIAYSLLSGTQITVACTQQALKNFIEMEGRESTIDPLKEPIREPLDLQQRTAGRQYSTVPARKAVLSLLKLGDEKQATQVRHGLEVIMRECERESLARNDVYERDLERRNKKRKRG